MKHAFGHITDRGGSSWLHWLFMSMLMLCLTACSSSDGDDENYINPETSGNQPGNAPTMLYIYVYSSETPLVTRAYEGEVSSVGNESTLYSMKIWVFTHSTKKLIGYYSPLSTPGLDASKPKEPIQVTIDETYAQTDPSDRETVDVYVLGNVTAESCNVTLDENSTPDVLEQALMAKTTTPTTNDPFGVTSPVRGVPAEIGLPMSGVLRNQPVTGSAPVLRLGNGSEPATVVLHRIVSKLRFAFSKKNGSETVRINSIKLNSLLIPKSEYIFMTEALPYNGHRCRIKSDDGYDESTPELLDTPLEDVASCEHPVIYAWGNNETLSPEQYEAQIEAGVTNNYLTQRCFYLRESDKKLNGTIKYQIGEGEEQTATFIMVDDNGFSRNHVWTVYAYPAEARLHIVVADIAPWDIFEKDYDFYNW